MSGQQILKPENIRIFFDSKEEPAAYADDGETVVFCCMDCYGKRITKDGMDYSKLLMPEGNPVTGPLYIRGAEPGDVLEIEIQDIAVDSFGSMCVRNGIGAYEITGSHCRQFPIEDDSVIFNITTLIISKKPGNTGISRDIRTEFTTDLLLSD